MRSIALSLLGAFILTGFSAQANCVSRNDMAEIVRDFPQFRSLANQEFCYDGSKISHLIAGLMFMRKTRFEDSMPASSDDLFSGRFASDWYSYFTGRINDFSIESNCPKGVGAYVRFWGNTMYVCPLMLSDVFTAMDRASVFMHEARHIDGYPHTTCRRGARAGIRGACDSRISDGGSYAVTVETYAQLARYAPDLNPALKAYAKASSVIYADEAFDTPTEVDRDTHFLALTKSRDFHLLDLKPDGTVETQILGKAPHLGKINMRAQLMVLFPSDKSLPAKYVFSKNEGRLTQDAGEFATQYNQMSPTEKSRIVDYHVATRWDAKIEKDKIEFVCGARTTRPTTVSLNGEQAVATQYPAGYNRANSSGQLMMASGKVFDFGCNGTRPFLRKSTTSYEPDLKRVYKSGEQTLGLSQDGKLYSIVNGRARLISTDLNGTVYEIAPHQSFQFFDGQ